MRLTTSKMKIIVRIGTLDTITLWRVRGQIEATAPEWATFTKDEREADVQIILAIGANGIPALVDKMPTIMLQLCYKTAHGGTVEFWDDIWTKCLMVGSYFDLKAPNFVRFPMGYNPDVFYRDDKAPKRYDAIVFGDLDGPEEIKSVVETFGIVAHISGMDMGFGLGYANYNNIPDDRLRTIYQQSKYCIGLRRTEGFEMPIVEGAACGCVPITFDLECYRHWFDGMAIFICEDDDVKSSLGKIEKLGHEGFRRRELEDVEFPSKMDISRFEQNVAWKPFWDKLAEVSGIEEKDE